MRKLYLALVGFATLTLLAGVNYWIASRHPGVSVPTAITSCIPCHIRVKSETDGIAASRFSKGSHPVNAAKIRPEKLSLDARDCGKCHQFEYTTWHESVHARAFTNHIFAHAVQRDREAWCLNCHTPLWSGNQADVERIIGWLAKGGIARTQMPAYIEQGITCAVCHDPHSDALVAQLRNPTRSTNYYTMFTGSRTVTTNYFTNMFGVKSTNWTYYNDGFASQYNPNIQICAQCHNSRGARWDGRSLAWVAASNAMVLTTSKYSSA